MRKQTPVQPISPERKTAYYLGGIVMAIGFLSFFSVFFSAAIHFGDFSNFESNAKSMAFRAFGGMFLLIVGGLIRGMGAAGLAGSGVILDPEQARKDVEPYSRMAGGIVNDALSEIEVVDKIVDRLGSDASGDAPREVIKVRCRTCQALNDETDKFCGQCGARL